MIKNKSNDPRDSKNYRPIDFATRASKVDRETDNGKINNISRDL